MQVLSIPAGASGNLIHRHKLYICPHNNTYESKLGNYQFLSFRHLIGNIKGASDRIYERMRVEDFDFTEKAFFDVVRNHTGLTNSEKAIVKNYYLDYKAKLKQFLPSGRYLLVFVREEKLLPNKPHPPVNNTFWAVYDYEDLLHKIVLEK